MWDTLGCDISPYFGPAAQYIHSAMSRGGKVIVNCQMGVSRSSALAVAFMILVNNMDAVDVVREFRSRRDVRPNDDFIEQIVKLDNDNRRRRMESGKPLIESLNKLEDLPKLPKPWHYEFWKTIPDESEIPFKLRHLGEHLDDGLDEKVGVKNPKVNDHPVDNKHDDNLKSGLKQSSEKVFNYSQVQLASENPFKYFSVETKPPLIQSKTRPRCESENTESSWEYYTDSESENDD